MEGGQGAFLIHLGVPKASNCGQLTGGPQSKCAECMSEWTNLSPPTYIFDKVQGCRNHTKLGDVSSRAANYLAKSLYHRVSISLSLKWKQYLPRLISSWNYTLYWKQPSATCFSALSLSVRHFPISLSEYVCLLQPVWPSGPPRDICDSFSVQPPPGNQSQKDWERPTIRMSEKVVCNE